MKKQQYLCPECNKNMVHVCDERGCGWKCDKCDFDSRKNKTHNIDWKEVLRKFIELATGGKK